ncbi:ionotropic receptor 93a [Caerostris extrusa]|uniref:Ionotropic receptor 93a n=1 Tax=Caerostris extrusa TaxID=172846 RepID=A0AAV4QPU8_CAEEX|nr:ionotropic receptor 93a [Caerostris extrusa]
MLLQSNINKNSWNILEGDVELHYSKEQGLNSAKITKELIRIARLFESGLFLKWKRDALPPDNECTTSSKPQAGDTRKINLSQMIGSFYILLFGICGALFALGTEYGYLFTKKQRSPTNSSVQQILFPQQEFAKD